MLAITSFIAASMRACSWWRCRYASTDLTSGAAPAEALAPADAAGADLAGEALAFGAEGTAPAPSW
eukprot:2220988-Rhodomonas_salina.1